MFGGLGASALQNAFAETQSPAQSRGESRLGAGAHSVVGFGQPNYGDEGGGAAAAAADDGEGNPSYSGLDEDGRPNWSTNTDWIRAHARLGSGMAPMPSAAKWATTAKRELLSKSFALFRDVQDLRAEQNTGEGFHPEVLNNMVLEISSKYILSMADCLDKAFDEFDNVNTNDLFFFYEARKAWYLADIFFFRRKDGPVLGHLLEWSRECNGGRESGDDGFREPEADRFWETAYKFLLKGMFDEFEDWLDLEVRARTEASSYAFLLEMLTGWRALNKGERGAAELDLVKWKKWRGECGRVNDDDARFQHDDGEKLIVCCRILAGDEGVLAKYGSELLEGWYELAVTKVLYTEPGARVPQLYKSITWAQQVYNYDPIDGSEYRLENMCNSIMNQDHFTFFKGACEGFAADDDWWFCCHFADLMDVRDPLDAARSAYGGGGDVQRSGFREYIVLDFATHMFQHPSLWSAAAEYFGSCPVEGEAALQAHLERVPLDSERKARKLIRLCQESSQYTTLDGVPFELHHVADDICKVMGKKAFAQSRTSSALGWYLQAKDGGRVAQIADHFLRLHKTNCDTAILDRQQEPPQFDPSDVVDTFSGIHPDSLVSDRLTFLVEYKKFHRIMATPGEGEARIANYKRAAAILVSTLVGMTYSSTAMAPCWFWLHLLLDACHWRRGWTTSQQRCPLLEHDTIIFDVEQTHVLLRSLAQLELSHNGYLEDEQDTDVMEEIYGALRLTLARNLSRAILVQP